MSMVRTIRFNSFTAKPRLMVCIGFF